MVEHNSERLDAIFRALSDTTRRQMLSRLAQGEISVTELAEPFDMSLAAVSKHLKVLSEADFVEKTRDGRSYRCRANLAPLREVSALLEELGTFWRTQLDSLERFLESDGKNKGIKNARDKKRSGR